MIVNELMTRQVECIGPGTSLQQAAAKMKEMDVGVFPVCDNDRLVGMVTDRDLAIRGLAEGKDPSQTPVRDVMTEKIVHCFDDQAATEASELMKRHQVRRLIVLNRDKRLCGIISIGDLATETHDEQLAGATLEAVSTS